jgi:hypothetical protein
MTTPLVKPTTIVEPFANSGSKNTIPVTASPTPGRASLDTGFPPLTMTPVAQGGVPPSGLDFNGILNWITQHTTWLNGGGQYTFDASLAAFIGGYPVGMVLQSNDGLSSYVNVQAANSTDFNTTPSSIGVSWLPYGGAAVSSDSIVTVNTTGGTTTLTGDQASKRIIKVTGVLTSNANIIVPNTYSKSWIVQNATTGAFTVNVAPSGGTSVPVSQGGVDTVFSNGTAMSYGQLDVVTQSPGNNTTKASSTAFVTAAIAAALVNTALTGVPTAPTAPQNTNNTQIATTEYADRSAAAIGAGTTAQYKNAAFTAGPTGDYWVDTSAGAFTMTLPDPPLTQNCIRIQDIYGTFSVNPLTINPGTKTVLGTSGNLIADIAGQSFEMWYDGSTWRLV